MSTNGVRQHSSLTAGRSPFASVRAPAPLGQHRHASPPPHSTGSIESRDGRGSGGLCSAHRTPLACFARPRRPASRASTRETEVARASDLHTRGRAPRAAEVGAGPVLSQAWWVAARLALRPGLGGWTGLHPGRCRHPHRQAPRTAGAIPGAGCSTSPGGGLHAPARAGSVGSLEPPATPLDGPAAGRERARPAVRVRRRPGNVLHLGRRASCPGPRQPPWSPRSRAGQTSGAAHHPGAGRPTPPPAGAEPEQRDSSHHPTPPQDDGVADLDGEVGGAIHHPWRRASLGAPGIAAAVGGEGRGGGTAG
jgi:hypothetical protein